MGLAVEARASSQEAAEPCGDCSRSSLAHADVDRWALAWLEVLALAGSGSGVMVLFWLRCLRPFSVGLSRLKPDIPWSSGSIRLAPWFWVLPRADRPGVAGGHIGWGW